MAGTLIFDGECGFCRASAEWCRRRLDPQHSVTASQELDDVTLARLGLTRDQVLSAAWWVEPSQPPAGGAEAIAACLEAMGGTEAVVGRFLRAGPVRPVAEAGYRWVADHRPFVSRWSQRLHHLGCRISRRARRLTRQ